MNREDLARRLVKLAKDISADDGTEGVLFKNAEKALDGASVNYSNAIGDLEKLKRKISDKSTSKWVESALRFIGDANKKHEVMMRDMKRIEKVLSDKGII